jgi:hypothetical protein
MAIELLITTAGLDALVDAQAGETDAIRVIEVGLTASAFTMAPTITTLPGEFKRLDAVSGQAVSETIIHMTAQDSSTAVYDLRGLGLYLDDGTLFAVYAQPDPLFRKVSIASFLLALDVAFANGAAGDIIFGDALFLLPPATETIKGVAEIATGAETAAGTDDSRIVTPLKLKQRLDALAALVGLDISALTASVSGLLARTITGSGLVTGGGALNANRVLSVQPATQADIIAGIANYCAVTPEALSSLPRSLAGTGHCLLPGTGGLRFMWGQIALSSHGSGGSQSVLLPDSFATAHFRTFLSLEGSTNEGDEDDEVIWAVPNGLGSFLLGWSANHSAVNVAYWSIGRG